LSGTDGTDLTLDHTSLRFTNSNWGTEQTVTVTAGQDDDTAADRVTISLRASGADYGDVTGSVTVNVTDNDTPGLTVSTNSLTVTEGRTGSFTVRLTTQPSEDVTVALSGTDGTDLTLDHTSLRFTNSNWGTEQTVTVTAGEDEDTAAERVTISLTASGADYGSVTGSVTVNVTDNDTPGLTVSTNSLTVAEGGSDNFTVRLTNQPSSDVTVVMSQTGTANSDITLDQASLTFTTTNWSTEQTVTVSVVVDPDALGDSATFQLRVFGTGYGSVADSLTDSVTVNVTDNDTPALTVSTSDMSVTEADSDSFTVALATRPSEDVTVALSGTTGTDLTLSHTSLSFTALNWYRPQTVTVRAARDDDTATDTATITLNASGGDYAGESAGVSVTVTELDTPALALSSARVTVSEGDSSIFKVRLRTRPSANVTVALSGTAGTGLTLDHTSLSFTTSSWSTAQTVTVSAAQDDNAEGETETITLSASGGEYAGLSDSLTVTVIDDDVAVGLWLSAASLTVEEGGAEAFTVRLAAKPRSARTVTLASSNPDVTFSPSSLTFTGGDDGNWGSAQEVAVSAEEDDDTVGDIATISLAGFGITANSVAISVTENDADTMPDEEEAVVKLQLAEIAGSLLSSTGDVIKHRFDAPGNVGSAVVAGQRIALDRSLASDIASGLAGRAGSHKTPQSRFAAGRFGAEQQSADWLGGIALDQGRPLRSGTHSTAGAGGALLSSFSYAFDSNIEGGADWLVWGRFDTRDFSGSMSEDSEYEGSQSGFWLGFDTSTSDRLALGLAFGSTSADSGYKRTSLDGSLDTSMTTLLPYMEITGSNGATARAMLGFGSGEITLVQADRSEITAEMSMELMSLSGSWPVTRLGRSTLSWTGGLGFSSMKPEGNGSVQSVLDNLNVNSTQFRGGMELEHGGLGSTWKAAPRLGMSLRYDGGDGATGTGVELTAGLQMRSSGGRFSLDISLRTLGMHSAENLTDTGASVEFRLNPRPGGEGVSLTLGPHWGAAEDDLLDRDEAFRLDQSDLRDHRRRQQRRGVAAELAYGLRALGGMLAPYSEYDFTSGEHGSMRQVAGVKFSGQGTLEWKLFGERRVSGRSPARSKLAIELSRQF
ncbi:MAG: hypothetical protein ISN29_07910, partial [Gammaproteobacteria bacterium AqS3]|nr:hypothetical protein [Gammaproteobacteria bacterium AqS3]